MPQAYTGLDGSGFIEFAFQIEVNIDKYKSYKNNLTNQFLKESGIESVIEKTKVANEAINPIKDGKLTAGNNYI